MKKSISILTIILLAGVAYAQEYKVSKSTGKLVIREVNNVTVEGTAGNEIIFSSMDGSRDDDDRAKGLRAVSATGYEDNTGIGLSVQDKGATVEVYQLKKMDGPRVKIQVPKGVSVYYSHTSPHGDDITFRNVEGEIETSTVHNGVKLVNVSGPLTIKTVHGDIEAEINSNMKGPITMSSNHGLVDVTIPAAAKLTMNLGTNWGEIFVDPAIKLEIEPKSDWVKYGSNKINGKVNGGGLEVNLSSDHGNVYLRKK